VEVLIALDGLLLVDRSVYFGSCAGILLQCFIREFVPDNDCNPETPPRGSGPKRRMFDVGKINCIAARSLRFDKRQARKGPVGTPNLPVLSLSLARKVYALTFIPDPTVTAYELTTLSTLPLLRPPVFLHIH